ncbi:hypothetical protein [Kineosphaera limosa]|uniref:hypothetical protein n=1 Tax=Kineosphaera limosa TaxID=111564 RepID=UPI0002F0D107|nr:hypothetical protein [Kineosphaera limosa]
MIGVDLEDHATAARLGQVLDDLLWSQAGGSVIATAFTESDPVHAALSATRRIHSFEPSARVVRVHPDLVTIPAIAARVGVSRQAVQQWVAGGGSRLFPAPYASLEPEVKPIKVWRWADVTPWLWEVKGLAFEALPTPPQVARIDAELCRLADDMEAEPGARIVSM